MIKTISFGQYHIWPILYRLYNILCGIVPFLKYVSVSVLRSSKLTILTYDLNCFRLEFDSEMKPKRDEVLNWSSRMFVFWIRSSAEFNCLNLVGSPNCR